METIKYLDDGTVLGDPCQQPPTSPDPKAAARNLFARLQLRESRWRDTLERDEWYRWYFFKIYPRDSVDAQWSFIGKVLIQVVDEMVIWEQSDRLVYLTNVRLDRDEDVIAIRCEAAETGKTIQELEKELKDVFGEDYKLPRILLGVAGMLPEAEGDYGDYIYSHAYNRLNHLRAARHE